MSIDNVIKDTFKCLLSLSNNNNNTNTKLIFPCYRNSKRRISEQEARFCFASVIEKGIDYCYSVETPTVKEYSFKGKKRISAQTDLSLWNIDGDDKLFNVEFKAHSARASSIEKDIEKLIMEDIEGIWFHLFDNINRGTFPKLADKFKNVLCKYSKNRNKDILFAVCVLKKNLGIVGILSSNTTSENDINAFFNDGSQLILDPTINQVGQWGVLIS